jgi:hypothetical protein
MGIQEYRIEPIDINDEVKKDVVGCPSSEFLAQSLI